MLSHFLLRGPEQAQCTCDEGTPTGERDSEWLLLKLRVWLQRAPGLSAAAELDVGRVISGIPEGDKPAQQEALARAAFEAVTSEYVQLEAAITSPEKRAAMAHVYQQPWLQ